MFFKDIEDLKAYIPINTTSSIDTYTPYLRTAYRKYILPYLSVALASRVEKSWQKENLPKAIEELLPYIQEPLANFAFVLAIPSLQVQVSDAGIHRIEDSNQLTAYKYQIQELINSHTEQAWYGIESLLTFLELNEKEYPDWAKSESSVVLRENFVKNTEEFEKHADIQHSRRLFFALKATMNRVESTLIAAALGDKLYQVIKKAILEDRILPKYQALLVFIKPAAAMLTLAYSSTDLVLQWYGDALLPTTLSAEKESKKIEAQAQLLQTWKNEKENAGMASLNRMKKYIMQFPNLYPEFEIPTQKISNDNPIFSF